MEMVLEMWIWISVHKNDSGHSSTKKYIDFGIVSFSGVFGGVMFGGEVV